MCSVVASLTGEMAAQSFAYHTMEQQTVTNPAVINGLYAMTKQQCMFIQAHTLMISHLTSTEICVYGTCHCCYSQPTEAVTTC